MSAIFSQDEIVKVDKTLYAELIALGELAELKRSRLCLHKDHESPIQEMIIALSKESYVRPHRHPNSRVESFSILEGEMDVFIFNKDGSVKECVHFGTDDKSVKIVRLENEEFHMPLAKTDWVIYHEILQGPFQKDEVVEYADWAPEEKKNLAEIKEYLVKLYG